MADTPMPGPAPLAPARRVSVVVALHVRAVLRNFVRDEGGVYAAAIAFYALVSMVPLAVLLVAVGGAVVATLGQTEVGGVAAVLEDVVTALQRVAPFVPANDLRRVLGNLVADRGNVGLLGLVGLMAAASQVVNAVRRAVLRCVGQPNNSDDDPRRLSVTLQRMQSLLRMVWLRTKTFFWMAVAGLLVGGLRLVAVSLQGWMDARDLGVVHTVLDHPLMRFAMGHFTGMTLTFVGFTALLIHVARRAITWPGLFAGAAMFSIMQAGAEITFSYYVSHYARLSVRYGSVANLVALALWVFYASCVFLLSVQLTAVISRPHRLHLPPPAR